MKSQYRSAALLAATLWALPLWRTAKRVGVQESMRRDARRFAECSGILGLEGLSDIQLFAYFVARHAEFRSIIHARLRRRLPAVARWIVAIFWRPLDSLYIYCDDIGPGLYVQHGFSTTITAKSIGVDCWINQQVTIGWSEHGFPTLGDRVRVGAAAVVVGPVHIGSDATIGANATVVSNVAAGQVMTGPKAMPVRR